MWLFNCKVADGFALLIGDLNFSKHTVADCAKYPNFIATLYEVIIALTNEVAIYRIEQEVIEDHERIKWDTAILKYKDRNKHAVVKQMLGHSRIYERLILLNFESWVDKILFHTTYDISLWVRKWTPEWQKGFELVQSKALQMINIFSNNTLADHVAQNWNTTWLSLLLMYEKLVGLDLQTVMTNRLELH